MDGGNRVADHLGRVFDIGAGGGEGLGGLAGPVGGGGHFAGDGVGFVDGALQIGGLTLGAAGQVLGGDGQLAGAGAQALDAVGHGAHGGAQGAGRGMEVVLQRAVFLGEDVRQRHRQVVVGQAVQGGAKRTHHFGLSRFGGVVFGLDAVALFLQGVEVDGDGQIHVQHDSLVQFGHGLGGDAVMFAAIGEQFSGPLDDGAGQVGQDHAVAADIPARLQTDAGVNPADGAHRGGVVLVGPAVDDGVPVALLGVAGGADVPFVAEEAAHLRFGAHLVVEGGQGHRRVLAQHARNGAVTGGRPTQAHEVHAAVDLVGSHDAILTATAGRREGP
ncbi:hypothetical protein ACMZ4W_01096 [Brevundimonas naejangsanensis]